jgi:hypothetical protein
MASWSTRRKYGFFFAFIIVAAIVLGVPAFFAFYKAPTCMDGKQNGGERGVDCGGECAKLCPADFAEPKVLWSYSMKIVPGVYNALAYVQNPNQLVEAKSLPYVFRLYDDRGILILERRGQTFVPAGQKFAVFEGALETGVRIPARTTIEFTPLPAWRQGEILSKIRVERIDVEEDASPRAEVRIKNESIDTVYSNVDAFVVLYDASGNRIAFSKTVIGNIAPGVVDTLYFTWPEAFPRPVVKKEALFVQRPKN